MRNNSRFLEMAHDFKSGSTLLIREIMFIEIIEYGFQYTGSISKASNLAYAFGRIVGMAAKAIYPEKKDFSFLDKDLVWSENNKKTFIWSKSLLMPNLHSAVLMLSQDNRDIFAAICAEEKEKDEFDDPEFMLGVKNTDLPADVKRHIADATWIKAQRKKKELSVKELCEKTGIAVTKLYDLERGVIGADKSKLARVLLYEYFTK